MQAGFSWLTPVSYHLARLTFSRYFSIFYPCSTHAGLHAHLIRISGIRIYRSVDFTESRGKPCWVEERRAPWKATRLKQWTLALLLFQIGFAVRVWHFRVCRDMDFIRKELGGEYFVLHVETIHGRWLTMWAWANAPVMPPLRGGVQIVNIDWCIVTIKCKFFFLCQYLSLIIIGTGAVFNVIFHVGIKEPPSEALRRWLEERKNGKNRNNKFGRKGSERKGEVHS